jgi:hypothetical protein
MEVSSNGQILVTIPTFASRNLGNAGRTSQSGESMSQARFKSETLPLLPIYSVNTANDLSDCTTLCHRRQ